MYINFCILMMENLLVRLYAFDMMQAKHIQSCFEAEKNVIVKSGKIVSSSPDSPSVCMQYCELKPCAT